MGQKTLPPFTKLVPTLLFAQLPPGSGVATVWSFLTTFLVKDLQTPQAPHQVERFLKGKLHQRGSNRAGHSW
eukprot:scaffold154_cov373-Prasinococcus_capsulatus_cf.AAC.15